MVTTGEAWTGTPERNKAHACKTIKMLPVEQRRQECDTEPAVALDTDARQVGHFLKGNTELNNTLMDSWWHFCEGFSKLSLLTTSCQSSLLFSVLQSSNFIHSPPIAYTSFFFFFFFAIMQHWCYNSKKVVFKCSCCVCLIRLLGSVHDEVKVSSPPG